jgi:hypothetical protein
MPITDDERAEIVAEVLAQLNPDEVAEAVEATVTDATGEPERGAQAAAEVAETVAEAVETAASEVTETATETTAEAAEIVAEPETVAEAPAEVVEIASEAMTDVVEAVADPPDEAPRQSHPFYDYDLRNLLGGTR